MDGISLRGINKKFLTHFEFLEFCYNFLYEPFGKERIIIKSDGSVDKQEFGESVYGKINDIFFEIQDPLVEMKDKIHQLRLLFN